MRNRFVIWALLKASLLTTENQGLTQVSARSFPSSPMGGISRTNILRGTSRAIWGFLLLRSPTTSSSSDHVSLSPSTYAHWHLTICPLSDGPLGHGSVVPMVEAYTNYIIQVLQKVQVEDIKRIQVKRKVAEDFTRHADIYLKRTAWSGPCRAWFKNGDKNRKPLCWPGSRIHYLTMLQKPRFEDFDIEYLSGNTFNFLGNGFDVREFDGRDLTWYYGLLRGEDKQPKSFPAPLY